MKTDLDRLLVDYFQPEPPAAGLARRVLREATVAGREAEDLVDRLAIAATPQGISLIRPGRQARVETAAGRRLVDRAREELHEYFQGQRAFFSVPLDLSAAPDFQPRCSQAAGASPSARPVPMRGWRSASAIRARCGRWAPRWGKIRCRSSCPATACCKATAESAATSSERP